MAIVVPPLGPRWNYAEVFAPRENRWVRRHLAAAWLLDEGAGLTVQDVSGGAGKGALVGSGVTWSRNTPAGAALDFTGTASKVTLQRSPSLRSFNVFTVMVLCRPTAYGASQVPTLIDLGARSPFAGGLGPIRFYLDDLTVANAIAIHINSLAVSQIYTFPGAVTLGALQILGVTCMKRPDGTGYRYQGYRDGRPVGTPVHVSHRAEKALISDPTFGALADGSNVYFGQIAGAWIWRYGMSSGQVARFCADPFGAWRFEPSALASVSVPATPPGEGGGLPAVLRRRRGAL